jgi:hypothetical protein
MFNHIKRTIGNFSSAVIHKLPDGEIIACYLRDDGLFDGSEPNVPMVSAGLPICGPVMLIGGADRHGNTLPPPDCDLVSTFLMAAEIYHSTMEQININRESPFTIVAITSFEELADALGINDEEGANDE